MQVAPGQIERQPLARLGLVLSAVSEQRCERLACQFGCPLAVAGQEISEAQQLPLAALDQRLGRVEVACPASGKKGEIILAGLRDQGAPSSQQSSVELLSTILARAATRNAVPLFTRRPRQQ